MLHFLDDRPKLPVGEATPAVPLAVTGDALLLVDLSGLFAVKQGIVAHMGPVAVLRRHAKISAVLVLAELLIQASDSMWPDVLAGLYIFCMNANATQNINFSAQGPA